LWERADQKRRREKLQVLLFNHERESLERELEASCETAHAWKSIPRFIVLDFGQYIVRKSVHFWISIVGDEMEYRSTSISLRLSALY
jgi:hypothetical protein